VVNGLSWVQNRLQQNCGSQGAAGLHASIVGLLQHLLLHLADAAVEGGNVDGGLREDVRLIRMLGGHRLHLGLQLVERELHFGELFRLGLGRPVFINRGLDDVAFAGQISDGVGDCARTADKRSCGI